MTKADLITKVAEMTGTTKADAEKSIDAVFSSISGALAGGDKFTLVGFGSFEVASRAAKKGRNPQTGQAIDIPASRAVKFKAGKGLKDAVK